jgi:hypothetical protein
MKTEKIFLWVISDQWPFPDSRKNRGGNSRLLAATADWTAYEEFCARRVEKKMRVFD